VLCQRIVIGPAWALESIGAAIAAPPTAVAVACFRKLRRVEICSGEVLDIVSSNDFLMTPTERQIMVSLRRNCLVLTLAMRAEVARTRALRA
jgi:hypothetical protein